MTFPGDPREPYQPGQPQPDDPYSTSWRPAQQPQYGPSAASVPPPISGPGYPPQNPPWLQAGTPQPKKKHTVRNVLLVTLAALVALCGIGTIIAVATSPGKAGLAAAVNPSPTCDVIGANGCTHKEGNGGGPVVLPTTAAAPPAPAATTKAPTTKAPAAATTKAAPAPAGPQLTAAQQQAKGKAQDYLDLTHFSRSGLIDQLKFDGFSEADATVGVDAIGVDWNAQAAGKAKDYLSLTHFSHSGLVDQLKFDGFTAAQAEYGVTAAGL